MTFPILQFGTSRFLQAHFDLFVDQGFVEGSGREKLRSRRRRLRPTARAALAFFNSGRALSRACARSRGERGRRRRGRGRQRRARRRRQRDWGGASGCSSTRRAGSCPTPAIAATNSTKAIVSRTAFPRSFPAKLTKLLHARFAAGRPALTLFPCELIEGNGDRLRALVLEVARRAGGSGRDFGVGRRGLPLDQFARRPHRLRAAGAGRRGRRALRAVGGRKPPGLVMPCRDASVVLTDDLKRYERLKLFILNLGHTYLAEGWAARGGAPKTVRAAARRPRDPRGPQGSL